MSKEVSNLMFQWFEAAKLHFWPTKAKNEVHSLPTNAHKLL
jgi:hypothetical protein